MIRNKYMTDDQVAEVMALWEDHGEALEAFAQESSHAYIRGYRIGVIKSSLIPIAAGFAIGVGATLGTKIYHKFKKKHSEKTKKDCKK